MIAYALTTRERLIAFLELTNVTAGQNAVLDLCIESATEFVEKYCDRRFMKTTYAAELHSGNGSKTLLLDNHPVISTEDVALYERQTDLNVDSWSTISSSYYFVDYDSGLLEFINGSFRKGVKLWKVAYVAGYDFDNTLTYPTDVGLADLEYCVWKLAGTMFKKRRGVVGVRAEMMHSYQVTYTKEVMESEEVKAILDKYASLKGNSEVYVGV